MIKRFIIHSIILSTAVKYGVNGYVANGDHSVLTSQTKTKKTSVSTSSTTDTLGVTNRVQSVLGLKLQTVPDQYGISLGGGYYMDNTVELSVGIRL